MAEFCKECFKEYIEPNAKDCDIVLTKHNDLCEGCGEWKPVVIEYTGK